ncbi:hypothetical protein H6768_02220 [Candidatus Peribacteria bacterium]|nr:hypothetical protein [Candidatus Peribacteria bacterium]
MRYAELLAFFATGVKQGKQTVITTTHTSTVLALAHDLLVAKIGKEVSETQVADILTRLGFEVTSKK